MRRSRTTLVSAVAATLLTGGVAAAPATAAITPSRAATDVAAALTNSASIQTTGASFVTIPASGDPVATADTALAAFPSGGGNYAILTTGDVKKVPEPTANFTGETLSGPNVRGDTDLDVTVLKVDVNVPAGANCLVVDFRFFSEEFPSFVGSKYNDAFIAELDASDWNTAGSTINSPRNFAFDPNGKVVSINASGPAAMNAENAAGTIYGGATTKLFASTPVTAGAHSVFFSIFDQGDASYDSAVFLDNLSTAVTQAGVCKSGVSTQPPTPPAPTPSPAPQPAPAPAPAPVPVAPAGPVGSKPPAFGPGGVIQGLPSPKKCVSRRAFRIRIRKRKGRTYISASVFVNRIRVIVRRGARLTAPVNLRGLPKGRFTVKIVVLTATGEVIEGTRKYRTCTKKRRGGRPGPL